MKLDNKKQKVILSRAPAKKSNKLQVKCTGHFNADVTNICWGVLKMYSIQRTGSSFSWHLWKALPLPALWTSILQNNLIKWNHHETTSSSKQHCRLAQWNKDAKLQCLSHTALCTIANNHSSHYRRKKKFPALNHHDHKGCPVESWVHRQRLQESLSKNKHWIALPEKAMKNSNSTEAQSLGPSSL